MKADGACWIEARGAAGPGRVGRDEPIDPLLQRTQSGRVGDQVSKGAELVGGDIWWVVEAARQLRAGT